MNLKFKKLLFLLGFGVTILTGCTGNNTTAVNPPGTPDYNMSERITTKTPTDGTTTGGTNDLTTDLNNLTNDGYGTATDGLFGGGNNTGYVNNTTDTTDTNTGTTGTNAGTTANNTTYGANNGTTTANDVNNLQTLATQCENRLNNVAGVQNSKVVLLGNTAYVGCKLNNATGTVPTNVKSSVLSTIKNVAPNITKCYVVTNDAQYNQVKACADNIRNLGNVTTAVSPTTTTTNY